MARKKQAQSKKVICDICGEEHFARGIKTHIRIKHKLNLTQVVTHVISTSKEEKKPDLSQEVKKPVNIESRLKSSTKPTTVNKPQRLKSGGQIPDLQKSVVVTQVIEKKTTYVPFKWIPDKDGRIGDSWESGTSGVEE